MGDQGFDLRCNGRQGCQGRGQPSDIGRSIWGTTQVVEDYTDEVCVAEMIGGDDLARKETESRKRRQQAWSDRQPNSTAKEWRPTKRPRVSSYNFIRYIDNQATLVITLWRDLPWGSGDTDGGRVFAFRLVRGHFLAQYIRCPFWLTVRHVWGL